MRTLLLALLLSQLALSTVQQPLAQKGHLSGVVLRTGTTQPVVGARVVLTRANAASGALVPGGSVSGVSTSANGADLPTMLTTAGPPPAPPPIPTVTTDRDGKFDVPDLDAGTYRLTITLNGYVKQEYGQRVFPGQGTILTLASGQSIKDLVVHLTPTGNVSGRIRDSFGQPASGVPVQVLKSTFSSLGQRILEPAGATRTNDRGEYRLYWVTPGRYYVAAGSPLGFLPGTRLAAGGPTVTPNESVETYVFTYYPGVSDLMTAAIVDVTPASELTIDFLMTQELYKISGRVLSDVTGRPPTSIRASLAYTLVSGGGGTSTFNAPYDPETGAFEMRDVLPGSYYLQIAAPGGVARVPLEVRNNVPGLNVTVTGGVSIPGRLSIEGQQDGADKFRAQLRLASGPACSLGAAGVSPVGPSVNADGTFRIENLLPGDYCVGFATANQFATPPEYYIKEARLDREDILGKTLQVSPSMPRGAALTIVLSPKVGQVEGIVIDDKQQPVAGVQAALIPERSRDRTDLYKAATTDQNGRFMIRAVAPGDYKLFAWATLESLGYFDPDLLKKSDPLGVPVRVAESSKVSTEVKVIPSGR
jgi:hypothetical protein